MAEGVPRAISSFSETGKSEKVLPGRQISRPAYGKIREGVLEASGEGPKTLLTLVGETGRLFHGNRCLTVYCSKLLLLAYGFASTIL